MSLSRILLGATLFGVGLVLANNYLLRGKPLARVVYFNNADANAASVIANYLSFLGYQVESGLGNPNLPLQAYCKDATLAVFLGGPVVNPYYQILTTQVLTEDNRIVVDGVSKCIVVAGYEAEDTLRAAHVFIRNIRNA